MACIQIHSQDVPLVFLVENRECVKVMSHFLHLHFRFVSKSSTYIEEEKLSQSRELEQSIFVVKT